MGESGFGNGAGVGGGGNSGGGGASKKKKVSVNYTGRYSSLRKNTPFTGGTTRRAPAEAPHSRSVRSKRPIGTPSYGITKAPPAPVDPVSPPLPNFMDLLNQALKMVQGQQGAGVDYSGLKADLQNRADTGGQKISDMYRQLQSSYAADAAPIAQSFADTGQVIQSSSNQATGNIDAAYNASHAQQSSQLAALGIQDAQGVLANNGNLEQRDAAFAKGNIEQNRAANSNLNSSLGQNAQTFNKQITQSAGMEGTSKRAELQALLQSKMAELGIAQQHDQAQAQQNSFSQALALAGAQQSSLSNQQDRTDAQQSRSDAQNQQDFQNQMAMKQYLDQQQQATASAARKAAVPQTVLDAVNGFASSHNINPNSGEWAKLLATYSSMYR